MVRKKVLRRVINIYTLKHGDWININTLKFISAKEKIELNDLIAILGITSSNGWRLKQNPFNQARINIFNSEEMKAIKVKINNEVIGKQEITEKNLERISKKYQINESIISKILRFNKEKDTRIKRGRKYIIFKKLQDEKELANELFIEEIKYNDYVTKEQIEYFKQKYNLNDEEIVKMLKVNMLNYNNLIKAKTKKMRIDLLTEEEKILIENELIEMYRWQDYITKNEIYNIKNNIKTTDSIIKDILSIPRETFKKLMRDEITRTRIILKETKLRMDILKMDIKYEYGEGYYTSAELRKLCRIYKIEWEEFLKNISANISRYPYIKQALKNNEKGLYIGEEHQLSKEFSRKNAKRIQNMCWSITKRYCYYSHLHSEREDIAQEAFLLILEKGGNVEKNFNYNEDLLFNLLASKVKYFVIGKRNIRYKEILTENIEQYGITNNIDDINEDFMPALDSRIELIHQYIMKIFQENKDYIYHNRKSAYKIIAHKLQISIDRLKELIFEIKNVFLEYGFAKECINGSVIDMSSIC